MAASETVRVIVRCRPMNQRELQLQCQNVITMNPQLNQVMLENVEQTNEPPKQFTFDAVYSEDSITENLYAESVFSLVESVLEGYNATVFAYGQTGCGKSFTMQGLNTPGSPQRGVIPRSFEHIFDVSSVTDGTKYLIRASYLEIYNESIRDLLGKDVKATLDIKEYVDKGVQVPNLTWHQCSSVLDCERLMDKGNRNRATGATLMNKDSSRSHSIFTIVAEMCTRSQLDGKEHIRAGKLNLVDLAGSERQSKTHAEGERLREATRINLSLSALGNVISALVDGRSKHIPYRDSKLTRLLQDSLGGNTKTLMIAAISPAHDNYDETLSTLRYANRAKNIKNKPRINEDPRDAQMKILQDEINRLKQELVNAGAGGGGGGGGGVPRGNQLEPPEPTIPEIDRDDIEREKERLREEFEREVSEIRRQCEAERLTKEEIQRKYDDLRVQYDTEIDALTNKEQSQQQPLPPQLPPPPPPVGSEPTTGGNKTKKKGGASKQKHDEENQDDDDGENQSSIPTDQSDQKQKLERLQELENKLVGGEEINNEERRKKRKKKLNEMKEKQEQRKRLNHAINTYDDDTLLKVFDNAQEQLHYTHKKLSEEKLENKRLRSDNEDLQHEFQREREGYLNTIREQEKKLLLYYAMVEKMSRIVPRSCNYSNIEKIKEQARFDEDRGIFLLPEPTREEVQLPHMSNGREYTVPSKSNLTTEYEDDFIVPENGYSTTTAAETNSDDMHRRYGRNHDSTMINSDDMDRRYGRNHDSTMVNSDDMDRRYGRNHDSTMVNSDNIDRRYGTNYDSTNIPPEKTRNKRQEQLLTENSVLQRAKRSLQMNNDNDYMNRRLNPYDAPARLSRKYGLSSDKQ